MKRAKPIQGFTLVDLLVIVGAIVVVAALLPAFLGHSHHAARAERVTCLNNLKQVGIGFRLYANDGAPYPPLVETNSSWNYFQTVGSEIASPKVLLCPTDKSRSTNSALDFNLPATAQSFAHSTHRNSSLSYFYGADCVTNQFPDLILAGDRHLSTNSTLLVGKLLYNTNSGLNWTKDLHSEAGNVALADGSAWQLSTEKLRTQLSLASNAVQRFILP